MEILFYIIASVFICINMKIIHTDIYYKKIPNILLAALLCLLPFWYIYLSYNQTIVIWGIGILIFQILVTLLVSFLLYSFSIWSAGDAKYLLVLSLFIPYIWVIPLIWNIAIITVTYLVLYFLYFYIWKSFLYAWYGKALFGNIYHDLKERIYYFMKEGDTSIKRKKAFFKTIRFIVIFLIIFTSLRLLRIYTLKYIYSGDTISVDNKVKFFEILETYHVYILILWGAVFIWLLSLSKYLYTGFKKRIVWKYKYMFSKKYGLSSEHIDSCAIVIMCIILCIFVIREFSINPQEISALLFLIFTLYIGIWICFKILWYSYKLAFQVSEQKNILIQNLQPGEIVDKRFLTKMFWTHQQLHNEKNISSSKILSLFSEQSPREYFKNIHNPIDETTTKELQEIYRVANTGTKKTEQIKEIQVINSFSFAPYLLLGFTYTYFYDDIVFEYIVSFIVYIVRDVYIS